MKVAGDVEIVNRLLSSTGMRSKGRCSRAQLGIGNCGSAGSKEAALLICTQQDRSGTKYMLKKNIECIFAKFIHEGKCTVRLRDPAVDICISKADSIQLKGFLSLLKVAASGNQQEGLMLAPLIPASSRQIAGLKTKMVIVRRSEYPVAAGFPPALETLIVNGCSLNKVEMRILRISRLVTLDLSNNSISVLPQDWSALNSLAELKLAKNRITDIPSSVFSGRRVATLAHLDLSENQLTSLPSSLINLSVLAVLKVDANQLASLPQGIGRLRRLIQLSAAGNQLQVLPGDFDRLTLQSLDLFGNPLSNSVEQTVEIVDDGVRFPTMFELAVRCIKNNCVAYSSADVGRRLSDTLDGTTICWKCASACLLPYAQYTRCIDLRQVSASVTAVDTRGRTRAPCNAALCSASCVARVAAERRSR